MNFSRQKFKWRTMTMTTEEPKVSLSGRYSINDTCKLLGICRDSLAKYTHETCEIACGWRTIGGKMRKYYLGSEILRFWRAHV